MKNINSNDIQSEVCESDRPVVIDIWAEWCGPCRFLGPILEKMEQEYPDIKFVKLNADDNPEFLQENGISGIPTMLRYDDGKLSKRSVGFQPAHMIKQSLGIK